MAEKKTTGDLTSAMQLVSGRAQPVAPPESAAPYVAPSRVGMKAKTFFLNPSAMRQLKQLALDQGTSEQDILVQALNDMFRKHGKPEVA